MTFEEFLRTNYGITNPNDPSQFRYHDASAGMQDFSRADLADAGYSSGLGFKSAGRPGTAGMSGWTTPNGKMLYAGDVFHEGDTGYHLDGTRPDAAPRYSTYKDTPDLGLGDLAMMVAFVYGGAFAMEFLGAAASAGMSEAAISEAATGLLTESGVDLAADGGINALSGFGADAAGAAGAGGLDASWAAGFTDGGTAGGALDAGYAGGAGAAAGGAGAANGMYDVLPEAYTAEADMAPLEGGLDDSWTNGFTDTGTAGGALDTGYAGSGAVTGVTGTAVPPVAGGGGGAGGAGGTNTVPGATDANYVNGSDINSDIATSTGVAPAGSVNPGTVTNAPGGYTAPATGTGSSPGTGGSTPSASDIPSWVAPLIGAIAGAHGTGSTETKRDIPDWLKPYVIGDSSHHGVLPYTNEMLDRQMAPGFLSGYDDMRSIGQTMMHTPQRGNQFDHFFPNGNPAQVPMLGGGGWLSPGSDGVYSPQAASQAAPQGGGFLGGPQLMASNNRGRRQQARVAY